MAASGDRRRGVGGGRSTLFLAVAAGFLGYFLATSWFAEDGSAVDRSFQAMNTQARLVIPARAGTSPSRLADMAEAAVREVDGLMGPSGPDSDVRRLNEAREGEWVEVAPSTWTVAMEALRWHRLTGGAFDPTIGPLKRLFKFAGREAEAWPDPETLDGARAKVGADKLLFEREGMRLAWETSGMSLDLGAIAKGYAVDRAVEVLLREGVESALVEVGGEIRTIGMKGGSDGGPWRTGIRNPRGADVIAVMDMTGGAVATSGDYENYFLFEGKRFQHIIDPRIGLPVAGGAMSVTVRHPSSCMAADALATTLVVMGPEETENFLKGQTLGLFSDGVEVEMYTAGPDGNMKRILFSVDGEGNFSSREEEAPDGETRADA